MRFVTAFLWVVLLIAPDAMSGEGPAIRHPLAGIGAKPKEIAPPKPEVVEAAIGKGVEFLLKDQNKDGSWGTPERTKDLNIYAPAPGAHHAFRSAVTALCVSALIEVGGSGEEVSKAID